MISLENIEVIFNRGSNLEVCALAGIRLAVDRGEFITLIGSNGAGKSTLLGAIAGDVMLTKGKIVIDGNDVTASRPHQRTVMVARVFQDPLAGTCASLSIEENMALALMRGKTRGLAPSLTRARRALFRERLAVLSLNLENRLRDPVGTLSGGQRQALSLIMATLTDSRILLLDEHTAALDPRMAAFVLELTQRVYQDYQLTVLMVTHSMQSALAYGQRLIMLHQGRVLHDIRTHARQTLTTADLLNLFSSTVSDLPDTLALG